MSTETMPQSTENSFEGVDNDELARRISDIDNALQEYSTGDEEANLKRGEMRQALSEELERRMNGDTAAAAQLIEKTHSENYESEDLAA